MIDHPTCVSDKHRTSYIGSILTQMWACIGDAGSHNIVTQKHTSLQSHTYESNPNPNPDNESMDDSTFLEAFFEENENNHHREQHWERQANAHALLACATVMTPPMTPPMPIQMEGKEQPDPSPPRPRALLLCLGIRTWSWRRGRSRPCFEKNGPPPPGPRPAMNGVFPFCADSL